MYMRLQSDGSESVTANILRTKFNYTESLIMHSSPFPVIMPWTVCLQISKKCRHDTTIMKVPPVFHLEIFLRGGDSNVSRNLEGQWIISCKYFKGGANAPPPTPPLKETLTTPKQEPLYCEHPLGQLKMSCFRGSFVH